MAPGSERASRLTVATGAAAGVPPRPQPARISPAITDTTTKRWYRPWIIAPSRIGPPRPVTTASQEGETKNRALIQRGRLKVHAKLDCTLSVAKREVRGRQAGSPCWADTPG